MATAAQSALESASALLREHLGESFAVGGVAFVALRSVRDEPDGLGGRITITELAVPRASFATLPAEGATITRTGTSSTYRLAAIREDRPGHLVLTVADAIR